MHPRWLRCSSLKYCPIFSVVAPCHRGASPASVRRRDFHHGLLGARLSNASRAPSAELSLSHQRLPRVLDAPVEPERAVRRTLVFDREPAAVSIVEERAHNRPEVDIAFAELAVLAALEALQMDVADEGTHDPERRHRIDAGLGEVDGIEVHPD